MNDRKELEFLIENMIVFYKKTKKKLNSSIWNFLALIIGKRKFFSKAKKSLYRLESHIEFWEKGVDKVLHHASTLVLIHTHKDTSAPKEDCNIAAQNIALGAPTLGLGATFIGYVQKSWENSKKIREIIELPKDHLLYAVLAVGYPKNNYRRLVSRPEPVVKFK